MSAEDLTSKRRTRVILLAGEAEAGKTTFVVELFARFLEGPFGGVSFAGSETLKAIDSRHRDARISSGAPRPTTARTQDPDTRLLHLELAQGTTRQNLLISDLKGELFENIRNGSPVGIELPLAARADMCVILIDGAHMNSTSSRVAAAFGARQLIAGLTELDGLRPGTPLLIVCSKKDLLDDDQLDIVEAEIESLRLLATGRGADATTLLMSARPDDLADAPSGLDRALEWLLQERASAAPGPSLANQPGDRYSWRLAGR